MTRFIFLGIIASFIALFFILNIEEEGSNGVDRTSSKEFYSVLYENKSNSLVINIALDHQQQQILKELEYMPFPKAGPKLEPSRSVIITTWRSGSTFLGEILNALPGNFYHYEPLLPYGIIQIRGPPFQNEAVNLLRDLLKCNYRNLSTYIQYGTRHMYLFTHNTRLWNQCELYPKYCWDATFLEESCKLYPFQSMKVVRLRLKLAEHLLKDKEL